MSRGPKIERSRTQHPCPRFATCSAPYCPFDPNRARTCTLYREPSCLYLREAVKADGKVPDGLRPQVDDSLRLVLAGSEGGNYLRTVLDRAAKQGSSRAKAFAL